MKIENNGRFVLQYRMCDVNPIGQNSRHEAEFRLGASQYAIPRRLQAKGILCCNHYWRIHNRKVWNLGMHRPIRLILLVQRRGRPIVSSMLR